MGLILTDEMTLVWSPESSAGLFSLYRDDTSDGYSSRGEKSLTAPFYRFCDAAGGGTCRHQAAGGTGPVTLLDSMMRSLVLGGASQFLREVPVPAA